MAGFFDGLYESTQNPLFLGGIGLMSGGFEGMQQGMQTGAGLQDRLKKQKQQASFIEALKGMPGVDQNTMAMLASNPELGQHVAGTMISNRLDPMADIKRKTAEANYQQTLAENGLFPLKKAQIESQIAQNRAQIEQGRNGKYGLNPIYGRDANGNPVVMQLGPAGEAIATKMPQGVAVDLGLKSYEQSQGKERGEAYGKAVVNLPVAENSADRMLTQIQQLKADKEGLSRVTGNVYGRAPGWTNYTDASKRAQTRINQVQGGVFLQAYNDLRGAGAITEQEGQAAKAAYARLGDQTMSADEYTKALDEFANEVVKLREIARTRAKGGNVTGVASTPSSQGVQNGSWSIKRLD